MRLLSTTCTFSPPSDLHSGTEHWGWFLSYSGFPGWETAGCAAGLVRQHQVGYAMAGSGAVHTRQRC